MRERRTLLKLCVVFIAIGLVVTMGLACATWYIWGPYWDEAARRSIVTVQNSLSTPIVDVRLIFGLSNHKYVYELGNMEAGETKSFVLPDWDISDSPIVMSYDLRGAPVTLDTSAVIGSHHEHVGITIVPGGAEVECLKHPCFGGS